MTSPAQHPASSSRDDPETTNPGAAHPSTPWRDDPETTIPGPRPACPVCRTRFRPLGRQYYCSDTCRKTAWRRRHRTPTAPPPVPTARPRRDSTVYACPDCDQRQLGVQRCDDCGTFMRRVAPGGPCPHCGDPVALTDLLDPPEVTPLP